MKVYLTRRYRFSASHRLQADCFNAEENRAIYGKCNNPYGHGHNYTVEVTVSGKPAEATGMICNLVDLDGCVEKEIVDRYGHANLNECGEFRNVVPTTENLCVAVFDRLKKTFSAAKVERVRIEETMMNSFEYSGDAVPLELRTA